MNRLVIKQNTVTENITSDLITKLYTEAKLIKDYEETNLILDSLVELQGNLLVPKAYDDEITYLETKFPNLHINTTIGRYIRFEDSTVQLIMALNFGDGVGLTTVEAATINGYNSNPGFLALFLSNANITSFNELKYFTNTTQIKYNTFYNCTNLESIDLRNITRIEQAAFRGCTKLKHILNYQNVQEWGYEIFTDCDLTGDYDFSASTIAINNDRALGFSGNVHLTSVAMPTGILKLCLFNGCTSLHTVSNTDNITDIIYSAFNGCTALKNVSFPNASTIGNDAFRSSGIESISLPALVTHNNGGLFNNCTSLTSVSLPNLLTTGDYTFHNCSSLTQISLPSLISMGNNTFSGCSNLTTVSIPQCSVIKASAFLNCSKLTSLTTSNITTVEATAFHGCSSLTSINLMNNCTSIGNSAFLDCTSLTTVSLPVCTTIGAYAFSNCTSLTQLPVDPLVVMSIGENAFYGCTFGQNQTLELNLTGQASYPHVAFRSNKFNKLILHWPTLNGSYDARYPLYAYMSELTYMDLSDAPIPPSIQSGKHTIDTYYYNDVLETVIYPDNVDLVGPRDFKTGSDKYLILLSITPPDIVVENGNPLGKFFLTRTQLNIYVPDSSLSAYLSDSKWLQLGDNTANFDLSTRVHGLSELPAGVWTTGLASQYLTPALLATS